MLLVKATRDFRFIIERTGCDLTAKARAIAAVDQDGRVRGMVAYDHMTESSVQMHVAFDVHAGRALLRPAFQYPFLELGKIVAIGIIPAHNEKSTHLALRLGFRRTHRIVDGYRVGVDLILMEMRRKDCRWLES